MPRAERATETSKSPSSQAEPPSRRFEANKLRTHRAHASLPRRRGPARAAILHARSGLSMKSLLERNFSAVAMLDTEAMQTLLIISASAFALAALVWFSTWAFWIHPP